MRNEIYKTSPTTTTPQECNVYKYESVIYLIGSNATTLPFAKGQGAYHIWSRGRSASPCSLSVPECQLS